MTYIRTIAIFMLLVSVAAADPIQWPAAEGGNEHYYEAVAFSTSYLSWWESKAEAEGMSYLGAAGHLATISSAAENEWVWINLGEPHTYYLGGYQLDGSNEPDGGWVWVTSEDWIYSNWAPGEPNNSSSGPSGSEECLQFIGPSSVPGQWNDADFENLEYGGAGGYILEYEYGPIPADQPNWGSVKKLYEH